MSFCRITGRARNLPKSHYFPINKTYNASELRRFCRVTGKSYGLPAHHFEPVVLYKKVKKAKNGKASLGSRDPNFGIRKHKILSSDRYVVPDFDSADDIRAILDEILEGEDIDIEESEKRFVYKIPNHKSHLIIGARMEAAIRSGAIEDIMFAKDGETIVIKTRTGQLIPLDLFQVKGRQIGELFEGEGKQEIETPEVQMKRVTQALKKLNLYDKIAENVMAVLQLNPEEKVQNGKMAKKVKQLKDIMKSEQYSNMLFSFLDSCVSKIVHGSTHNGVPIKGLSKKAHKDEEIIHILNLMFEQPSQELLDMQQLLLAQEEGENTFDRVNGTVARVTPGTLDYVIANINNCDPNQLVMNILQMSIQSFLKQVSSMEAPKQGLEVGANGLSGKEVAILQQMGGFQEFLDQTVSLLNCLTHSCGEPECYGADIQTILMDFIHQNATRCNFETPKVEMVKEISVSGKLPIFYTHDAQELETYMKKHKKKCRDKVLVIKDGIKVIVPKSMLKYIADRNAAIIELDDDGIDFVLDAISTGDDFLFFASEEGMNGIIDINEYKSNRPRRKSSVDTKIVKSEMGSYLSKIHKQRSRQKPLINPNYKNTYKKYEKINDGIYMFRAYSHTQGPNRVSGTRY